MRKNLANIFLKHFQKHFYKNAQKILRKILIKTIYIKVRKKYCAKDLSDMLPN